MRILDSIEGKVSATARSHRVKITIGSIVIALGLMILVIGRGVPGKVIIYARNVGCDAKDFQVVLDENLVGDPVTVPNDEKWVNLGEYDLNVMIELRILHLNGDLMAGRGLGRSYFKDLGGRNIIAVTILQQHIILTMKHKPPDQ